MKIEIEVQDEHEAEAIRLVVRERRRQDDLFGVQDHDPAWWMVIMGEEYGETCQAVCDYKWGAQDPRGPSRTRQDRIAHAMAEASQVSAVAVAMIQSIMRDAWKDEISTVTPSDKRQVAKAINLGDESGARYDEPDDDDGIQYLKCYYCNLDIEKDGDGWAHVDNVAYQKWLLSMNQPDRSSHKARFEPICTECGRDNANGTHSALERTGHLSHAFTLEQKVAPDNIESAGHVGGIKHGGF